MRANRMEAGRQRPQRLRWSRWWTTGGASLALLLAFMLALFSGALLKTAPAQAAQATFYGVNAGALTSTAIATDTVTTAPTATDTPIVSATATATSTTTTTTTSATATATSAATTTATVTSTATATATSTATATPAATATPSGPPPKVLDISAAAAAVGTQQYSNWCGIATVALIADYLGSSATQSWIFGQLNDTGNESIWGTPSKTSPYAPYLPADIARDFGTDPRSLAQGLTVATGLNYYHAVVDTNGAWDTSKHIISDMLTYRQPISVIVDHGQHSVVVYGVDATGDPITNPSSITAIHVWDPGGGISGVGIQPQVEMDVPISQWLSGTISWSGSDYFKYPYAANVLNGVPLDPDPAVGPYTYDPSKYNHLWIGHYVYITPGTASLSADWEVNQYGALIVGYATADYPASPPGYTGPTVPMPTNPPPPPPPVQVFKVAPPAPPPTHYVKPKAIPKPTPTPRPTPRLRPSPTPDLPWPPTPIPSPAQPVAAACTLPECAMNALPFGWLSLLGAALLLGLLLLSGALIFPRRARLARASATAAALEAGEAAAPPIGLVWLAADASDAVEGSQPATRETFAALAEPDALTEPDAPAAALEPTEAPEETASVDVLIVPVLEADATSAEPAAEDEPGE